MAGCAVLKEVGAAMQLHESQQMVLQHTLVAFSIHCENLGQKVEATTAHSARKALEFFCDVFISAIKRQD
jgi:hypothetical protein